jgi:hypothetical protein
LGILIPLPTTLPTSQYDIAYGNKLMRIAKEAEYILEHESHTARFVPPKQAPFSFVYDRQREDLVKSGDWDQNTRVGECWPSPLQRMLYGSGDGSGDAVGRHSGAAATAAAAAAAKKGKEGKTSS